MNKLLLEEADKLLESEEYEKVYKLLLPYKNVEDDEILWRLARAIHDLNYFNHCNDTSPSIKRMNEEALQLATKALEINKNNPNVLKTLYLVIDAHYKNVSVKARIQNAVIGKNHLVKALELDPKDPENWYLMGTWHFSVADASWVVRKLIFVVLSALLEGSYEDALTHFQKALDLSATKTFTNHILALLWAGKCCIRLKKNTEGVQYLKKILEYPEKLPTQKKAHTEARQLLKDLKIKDL